MNYDIAQKVQTRNKKELNVITLRGMNPEELTAAIYPLVAVPVVSPNTPIDIENEVAPLLSVMANEAAFLAHMYSVAVSVKAALKRAGTSSQGADNHEAQAKIDILYRAHKAAEDQYSALSRVLKILENRPHSALIKSGT
jgi:hypothetical protein